MAMSNKFMAKLKANAKPDCPECHGEGVVMITPSTDPTGGHDWEQACICVAELVAPPDDEWDGDYDWKGDR
jgi:hypothetical protein